MALKSNQTEQMAKRLKSEIEKLAPEFKVENSGTLLTVKEDGAAVSFIKLQRRSFDGFNIAYELSESAGQGFPEHECFVAFKDDFAHEKFAKIVKCAASAGCSEMKLCKVPAASTLDASSAAESSVTATIPNDARIGSVGA